MRLSFRGVCILVYLGVSQCLLGVLRLYGIYLSVLDDLSSLFLD
jgi:hypothetical protein